MINMKLVIIKIGSKVLTTQDGKLNLNRLRDLVLQVSTIKHKENIQFILVSSGAITCGSESISIKTNKISDEQAAAALGQVLLMKEYYQFFEQNGLKAAQILITRDSINNIEKKSNIVNTIQSLIKYNVVPIINENDTVSTEEIQFGDNDILSSEVAVLLNASTFIMLTDQNGIYTENPNLSQTASVISELEIISQKMIEDADDSLDNIGRGGIKSKLMAAKYASDNGVDTYISNGNVPDIIRKTLSRTGNGTFIKGKKHD